MTDYIKAFQQGLSAAEETDRTRNEINSIFDELDKQILEKTSGKIKISRQERIESPVFPDIFGPKIRYNVICAFNPKVEESPTKVLANWTQDRRGYPCKIEWEGTTLICEDGEALKNALAELLADPLVGEKLYTIMKLSDI